MLARGRGVSRNSFEAGNDDDDDFLSLARVDTASVPRQGGSSWTALREPSINLDVGPYPDSDDADSYAASGHERVVSLSPTGHKILELLGEVDEAHVDTAAVAALYAIYEEHAPAPDAEGTRLLLAAGADKATFVEVARELLSTSRIRPTWALPEVCRYADCAKKLDRIAGPRHLLACEADHVRKELDRALMQLWGGKPCPIHGCTRRLPASTPDRIGQRVGYHDSRGSRCGFTLPDKSPCRFVLPEGGFSSCDRTYSQRKSVSSRVH